MSKRGRRFRLGRHWVTDEKTGFAEWDDNIVRDWDGVVTKKGLEDGEHPQWRIRALQDPYPVELIRPERGLNIDQICGFFAMEYVPRTTIKRTLSLNDRLPLPGIGQMAIGNAANECGHWFVVGPSTVTLNYALVVNTNTSRSDPSINHTIKLPNGINMQRLVVLAVAEGATTFTWPVGWDEIFEDNNSTVSLSVAYHDVDGTEGFTGTDDIITVTTSSKEATTHISYLVDNFFSGSPPFVSTGATGNSTSPDPDDLTPADGLQDYLTIIVEAHNTASTDTTDIPLTYESQIESKT